MSEILFPEESYNIIGAAMEVHKHLGHGFLEPIYHEALALEFSDRSIPYKDEVELFVRYKKYLLKKKYKADFVCYGKIIIEIKALEALISEHEAVLLNYLYATHFKLGILINFGQTSLIYKRMVLSHPK